MYQYYIYGLGIHSEIKLYNLEEVPSAPDVTVRYASVPDDIAALTAQGLASSISSSRIWFRNDSGHFIIRDGNEILVSPLGNADEKELASFIMGWSLSFLFLMRGFSAIHCSAIEIDAHRAALIAGVSGAMAADEKLPSVRALATQLSINPNTIQRAYNELENEGFIYSVPGKGSFASATVDSSESKKRELENKIRELAAELRYLGVSEEELLTLVKEVQS